MADRWLLLHGTPMTPLVWDGVRGALEVERPVLAPHLATPRSAEGAQAELAAEALGHVGDGDLHVVGHSFGGQVAIEVALLVPERVRSLTILCSRATPFPGFATAAADLRGGAPVDVDATLGRWLHPTELAAGGPVVDDARACLASVDVAMWADELDAIATYDRVDALRGLAMPVTAIAADRDQVGTVAEMAAIAHAATRGMLEVIPDASHLSPFLDPSALAGRLQAAAERAG